MTSGCTEPRQFGRFIAELLNMHPERRGWGAFGAYTLSGELPRERELAQLEAELVELSRDPITADRNQARIEHLEVAWLRCAKELYRSLEPWETVFVARHPNRPLVTDYIRHCVQDFCELHGDRLYGDDQAIVTGFGYVGAHRVMIIGHNRGRSLPERVSCNFGCPHPEGYRKALSKMQLAAKYGLPVISLIDTPGAYPGMQAEERGVARAIALNLSIMPRLKVPLIAVVIGEGGSGGALGIAVSDRMAMLEHSIFSVISPEGCSAILWKDSQEAKQAASALKLRAADLHDLRLIDEIIPEPVGGAHRNHLAAAIGVETFLVRTLNELKGLSSDELLARRYERLRALGAAYVCAVESPRGNPDTPGNLTTKL
jgi:acetyl-CoA carboxylase carboxyl transferase subunit alpha